MNNLQFYGFTNSWFKLKLYSITNISTLQDKQNECSFKGFRQLVQRLEQIHQSFLLFKTSKMNGHFMGFRQLRFKIKIFLVCCAGILILYMLF